MSKQKAMTSKRRAESRRALRATRDGNPVGPTDEAERERTIKVAQRLGILPLAEEFVIDHAPSRRR